MNAPSFMRRLLQGALLATALGLSGASLAHELPDDRLTVIQRDGTHYQLQFLVDGPGLVHRFLGGTRPRLEVLAALVAQGPEETSRVWGRLQLALQQGVRLQRGGQPLRLEAWRWPSGAEVHACLQQWVMQQTVGRTGHVHEEPWAWSAQAVATGEGAVELQLPTPLQQVMVVSYRPRQQWVSAEQPAVPLSF